MPCHAILPCHVILPSHAILPVRPKEDEGAMQWLDFYAALGVGVVGGIDAQGAAVGRRPAAVQVQDCRDDARVRSLWRVVHMPLEARPTARVAGKHRDGQGRALFQV